MIIKNQLINNNLYIELIGELDECTAKYTKDSLDKILLDYKYNSVIFELSKLDFMDSTGIGVLLGRYKKLQGINKNIYICNPKSTTEKIFRMSGIYEIMPKIS